ncbi:MAG: stress response translation initiation inhibitor YciH [Candidatus Woesearchaeota archaeon]|nr:MAG: stress response translation initiation inhibitor YciH [Candidatus Woesearchaeota archaeon]
MVDICTVCGLPQDLCVCESIAKEKQKIRVSIIKKKFGKKYTVIEGLNKNEIDLKELAKKLKNEFACGGTGKGDHIELQGDHLNNIPSFLEREGFARDAIDVERPKFTNARSR